MSSQRKATFAKRQRELDQKDRVREREARRAARRVRAQQRAAGQEVASTDASWAAIGLVAATPGGGVENEAASARREAPPGGDVSGRPRPPSRAPR